MIDSRDFLEAVSGYTNTPEAGKVGSADRPVKLGYIDPYYTAGLARVLFEGETVMSLKGYAWASGYSPAANERVYLVPVGQSYIIGGKVQTDVSFPAWFPLSPSGTLLNGWVTYDAVNYHTPSFTKTASGVVKLAGLIKSGTIANNTPIATLPVGFRPQNKTVFPVETNGKAGTVAVDSSGVLSVTQWADNAWLSLDNIIFPTEILTWKDVTLQNSFTADTTYGAPQYALDSKKRIWFRGAVTRGSVPTVDNTTIFTLDSTSRVGFEMHLLNSSLDGSSNFGFVGIQANGTFNWKNGTISAHIPLGGLMTLEQSQGWIAPTLLNSWVNYDASVYSPAGWYKDIDGVVHLRGLVKSGAQGTVIFNLPAGRRPLRTTLIERVTSGTMGRVDIWPSGDVVASAFVGGGWMSLDGISFVAEA